MSSYVVEDETINKVLSHLVNCPDCRDVFRSACERGLVEYGLISDERLQALGADMLALNIAAVEARYGNGTADNTMSDYHYRFQYEPATSVQAFKALRCFLYQCNEGDISERMLYRWLEDIKYRIACEIISALPEYQVAKWG